MTQDIAVIEPLNAVERGELQRREQSIEQSLQAAENAFSVAKTELLAIMQSGLYREHGDFKTYIRKRWKKSKVTDSRRRQIWLALETYIELARVLPSVTTNERQMRSLRKFPEEHRDTIFQMADSAAKTLNKPLSNGVIERVGNNVMAALVTGTMDGSNPITAAIIEDEYEATERQKQYMSDNSKYEKLIGFQEALVVAVDGDDKTIRLSGWDVTPGEIVRVSVFVLKAIEQKAA